MAPRTRSDQAGKLAAQRLLSCGITVNTYGFPAFPPELYLEILSYLPGLPIPHDMWVDKEPDPYRQLTLYYLSQTCRSLRKFFLRYAWERIEVFGGMWTPLGRLATDTERKRRGWEMKDLGDKKVVQEILRQLETVVVRNPDLQQYVSIVNIPVPNHSHESVLPEMAQNFTLFPNLHTIQLIFWVYSHQRIFSEFRYPNVHTVSLSHLSPHGDVLRACPNTKHFSFYEDAGRWLHLQQLLDKEVAGNIEELGIVQSLQDYLTDVVKGLPRLRDISFDCWQRTSGVRIMG